jgi:hypothetical protein
MDRETIEEKLDALRQQRGAAVLDKTVFDSDAIVTLETKLSEIDDAAAEQARRQRAKAEATHQSDLSAKRAQLSALIADDLADTKVAEDAARALSAAISRKLKRVPEMARVTHEVSGAPVPICLHFPTVMSNIGGWVAAIIGAPLKPRGMLGPLKWSHVSLYDAQKSWRDSEAATYAKHLTPLTKDN